MHVDRIWYLVMNSTRARIVHGLAAPRQQPAAETVIEAGGRSLRDTLDAPPTRSFSSGSPGRRSGVEPGTDPLREDALRFVRAVVRELEDRHEAGEFDALVVIAAPEILGHWRDEVDPPLRHAVRRELARNLVPVPAQDLAEALRETLAD
ncbi:MAG: host attachment protein [Rubellimicrobium sp.]|nr:host attachment protein [Rubellimicrobium sp.]